MIRKGSVTEELLEILCAPEPTDVLERLEAESVEEPDGTFVELWKRHVYIIGQTGAGKSGLLELFALSDIFHGQGYAIIDRHGDFAINNMRFIPGSRLKDIVYFNPADTQFPLGFNPLEVTNPEQKNNISSEEVLKKQPDSAML